MESINKRLEWIDICKGLGIILVVLGHTQISTNFVNYIFSFHMPLFFFISGYLFSTSKYPKFLDFLKRKIKTIIIPYIFFSFISILAFSFIVEANINLKDILQSLIISKRNFIIYNVPLWFLTSLFLVEIMYFLLKKYIKNKFFIFMITVILSVFAVLKLKTLESPKFLWTFDSAMYYMIYFGIGNILFEYEKNTKSEKSNVIKVLTIFVFMVCFLINITLFFIPEKFQFVNDLISIRNELSYIWFLTEAFSGITVYVLVSRYIKTSKLLEYLGANSLIIFSLHVPFGLCIIDKLKIIFNLKLDQPYNVLGIVQTIFILLILYPIIGLINKHFSFIIGRSDSAKTIINFKSYN